MAEHPNHLLRRLDPQILDRLLASSKVLDLPQTKVLAETHGVVHHVYFPHSGIISNVVELVGGGAIETAMVGRDGVFGAAQALDDQVSLNHVVIQVPVIATVIDVAHVASVACEYPDLRKLLLAYEQFSFGQVQQTAACNAVHKVQERLCKWLLRMFDLTEGELPLTQEFLAQMMGVRRTSVTDVAGDLAASGLITYKRGRLQIVDVKGLRARSCECNDEMRLNYERLFPPS